MGECECLVLVFERLGLDDVTVLVVDEPVFPVAVVILMYLADPDVTLAVAVGVGAVLLFQPFAA